MTETSHTIAQTIAARLNAKHSPGDHFANAYYGWAGTPWRPADTSVTFKRCWAEDEVLYIETCAPYEDLESSYLVSIHRPRGAISLEGGVTIELADKVVVGGKEGLPRQGPAFEAA